MDLDAFFVSVEVLRNPELAGLPLVIGSPTGRGVVTSASYEARKFGIHSAMPGALAKQLCPDALFISGDMDAYSNYSHMVTEIIREESPVFEKSSIDEFYIDITGMDRYICSSYLWGKELRQRIVKETGLPISMGLSVNKLVSKVATSEYKPNGQKHIEAGHERDFFEPLNVQKIPMIGKQTTRFLYDLGVKTVRTLRKIPVQVLESAFGRNGRALLNKANAIDHSPVVQYSERKSISTECTFSTDSMDVKRMKSILTAMVEKLTYKLREEKMLTSCIAVKIRYTNFDTVSKQLKIPYNVNDQFLITRAHELFDLLFERRMMLRLIGVRFSGLVHGNYQISLFDDTEESIRLHQAMDAIRFRYGPESLFRAETMDVNKRIRMDVNPFHG